MENQKNRHKMVLSVKRAELLWAQLDKVKEWKTELNWKNTLHSVMSHLVCCNCSDCFVFHCF